MKLKTLLLVVALLAVASTLVYFLQQPSAPAATDPRVGEPLLATSVAEQATLLRLTDQGKTVELVRQGDGAWRVASFHDLPADFGKLSRFVKDLTEAKVERLVTSSPEALGRLGFGTTSLTVSRAGGEPVWSVDLGRTADGGGRFVRFGDEAKAYRVRLTAWLDTTARNWADASLLSLKPEQVARVELDFPEEDSSLRLERGTAEEPFQVEGGSDRNVRQSPVTSLLNTLSTLRFTETTEPGQADATAARANLRRVQLTTFDGDTVTIGLGRRPEQRVESPPPTGESASADEPPPEASTGPDSPPVESPVAPEPATTPAGPVYAFVEGDPGLAKLSAAADRLAFQVSDYVLTSLPKTREDLLESRPPETPAAAAPEPAAPAEPVPAEP